MMKRLFGDVESKRKQKCIVSVDEFIQKTCEMAATIWAHSHFLARKFVVAEMLCESNELCSIISR